ncbi:MAG: LapA family protein [Desulfobacterales bacterium]|nr:LapA family protein [Desulfobacterales bacterium]
MKSLRPVLLSLAIIFLMVVVLQNREFFMHREALRLNLLIWKNETVPIPLSVYFLGCFLVGLLLSYFYGLSERFKAKKIMKNHLETIHKLEEEIKVLKSLPIAEQNIPQKESESA